MGQKGEFRNFKLGKNVYRQVKRRGEPDRTPARHQPGPGDRRLPPTKVERKP